MSAKILLRYPPHLGLLLAISICGFTPPAGAQQAGKVILISPEIGRVIDPNERSALGLFPDVEGFLSAMFYQLPDSSFAARVVHLEDGRQKLTWRHDISTEWLERLRGVTGGAEEMAWLANVDRGDTTPHVVGEPAGPSEVRLPKVRTRQLFAPGILVAYYWPSLKTLGESLEADLVPGVGYGARATLWTIPRLVLVADYFRWTTKISGATALYRVDTRLTVESVMLTAACKIAGDLTLGSGLAAYFCDYRCDYGEKHRRNEGLGAHVALGLLGGPHWETVNLSLEARYVLATVGETARGFPKTELSGPVIMASVLF
jgi:hypothetical protein